MKKLLSIFAAASLLAACNSSSSTSEADSTTTVSADTTSMAPAPDTSSMSMATDTSAKAAMKDGVMTLKDGKMMVMQGGSWQPMTADVTCSNGVKVSTKGEISKGSKKKTLTEGMMIDKDGQLTDANGKLVDNAGW